MKYLFLILPLFLSMNSFAVSPEESRKDWEIKTQGKNVLLGKEAWFSKEATWPATQSGNDRLKLTDGKISGTNNILRDPEAVGWRLGGHYLVLFELEETTPISHIVARILGGAEHPMVVFPSKIEVIASQDGKTYHSLGSLQKLLPGDKDGSDWKSRYFLPEDGMPYIFAFSMDCKVRAKFIGFRIETPGVFLFMDEIAAIKGEDSLSADLSAFPTVRTLIDKIAITPRTKDLWITENIITPNWLISEDTRREKSKTLPQISVDLPEAIDVIGWGWSKEKPKSKSIGDGRVVWELPLLMGKSGQRPLQGPLYLKASALDANQAYAIFRTSLEGEKDYVERIPIKTIRIPDAGDWEGTHISIGWLWESFSMSWPDFFETYRTLGFNYVPAFPRYEVDMPTPLDNDFSVHEKQEFFRMAKAKKFKIIYNESPFHVLYDKAKSHPEILNLVSGKPGKYLSPIYRGSEYEAEIERVARHARELKPDILFYDIELWYRAVLEAKKTPLFQQSVRKSGKDEETFLSSLGTEMLSDLKNAIGKDAPVAGLYNVNPAIPIYHFVFKWDEIYPQLIDFAMPSLYVQGDAQKVHDSIRGTYDLLKKSRQIIPWLTAGTYGEFDPKKMEAMIYETLLNGAKGFTYYTYPDFDPLHFYYHAKALHMLYPYKKIVQTGEPATVHGSNPKLTYSALSTNGKWLILIGNYNSSHPAETTLTLPDGVSKISDIRTGKITDTTLNIPGHDCLLLYAE